MYAVMKPEIELIGGLPLNIKANLSIIIRMAWIGPNKQRG